MTASRPPPTDVGSGSSVALHLGDEVLTVWRYHRDLGLHDATWEQLDQYEITEGFEVSGSGRLIKRENDVWYLLDSFDSIDFQGEKRTVRASD